MENKKWLDLEGKSIIVTGGSSGIGEALVEDLLNCGAKVAIIDIQEPQNNRENTMFIKTDIKNHNEVTESVKNVVAEFGVIDGLVNVAGVTRPRILIDYFGQEPKYEIDEEDFNFMVDINMKGTLNVTQEVARVMVKQKHGVIVMMSSAAGINGSKGHGIYAATKAAQNSYTLSWSKELAPYNIRVVSVAPDILDRTPANNDEKYRAQAYGRGMDINTPPEEFFRGYKKSIPLGRPGHLIEVANVVTFLLSDHASYLTGIVIPVAGGKTRN